MWVALVTIAAAAILVFTTTRSRPSASKEPPAAAVATSNRFLPTVENKNAPPGPAPEGMVWIPGGEFSMGAQDPTDMHDAVGMQATTDSRPVHRVFVDGFWMDATEVTNEQFALFVKATGYVTVAEQTPRAEDFPGAPPERLVPGSVIFTPPDHAVPLTDAYQWWSEVSGASWRHPLGPKSSIAGKERFPVVHIAYADALAYAQWARKRLPTEAEWAFAARGGLTGQVFPWGNEFKEGGAWGANTHQGHFPSHDTGEDSFVGIAPVAQFPPNGYGLYDIAGNVWEWISDWYRPDTYATEAKEAGEGGLTVNPQGPETSFDPGEPHAPKRINRGGSFLCNAQYCASYRPSARMRTSPDTGQNHLGFRCVMTRGAWDRQRNAKK